MLYISYVYQRVKERRKKGGGKKDNPTIIIKTHEKPHHFQPKKKEEKKTECNIGTLRALTNKSSSIRSFEVFSFSYLFGFQGKGGLRERPS